MHVPFYGTFLLLILICLPENHKSLTTVVLILPCVALRMIITFNIIIKLYNFKIKSYLGDILVTHHQK